LSILGMAWRNVWRNRRRSGVTIAAMSLALLVMILYAALMEGYLRGMERSVVDLEMGDVQIFAGDYRTKPSIDTRIDDPSLLLAPLQEAGFRATTRLLAFGLAAAEESSAGASFRGVDVERDALVSEIHLNVERGTWLDPADPKGVVIGRRLALTLGVDPGEEIVVLSQGADGALAAELFRVRGVLRGISDATDRTGIFMTDDAFRELLVVENGVHQIIVRRPADLDLETASLRIRDVAPNLDVRTWRQLAPTIASLLDSARGVMIAMFLIVYLAVAIMILNAMLMAVFERIREFGVLKALGVGPFAVLQLILVESAILTALAIVIGLLVSLPILWFLVRVGIDLGSLAGTSVIGVAMDPVWRAAVDRSVFIRPIATLLAVVSLAVVYPALKAALIRPVEAMHHH
jgi:ABC-type lipoprotein release transport system permease subunit